MRLREISRWPAAAVAGIAALALVFGVAGAPPRTGPVVRGVPRAVVAAEHAVDASGLPAGHHHKPPAHVAAVDGALTAAMLGVVALAVGVTLANPRRIPVLVGGAARPRGPPARH